MRAKPASWQMDFRSAIGSLPVPPTFTARSRAMYFVMLRSYHAALDEITPSSTCSPGLSGSEIRVPLSCGDGGPGFRCRSTRATLAQPGGYTCRNVQFSQHNQLWVGGIVFMDHHANTAIDDDVIDKAIARIDYARQKTGRSCGSCSMCCYMMGVEAIDKPKYRWCQHCKPGKGCAIYTSRPGVCKAFACMWLIQLHIG